MAPVRVARARRIANKCDHCIAYGDQACVSACPTGSLIEINAYDLFRERSPAMAQLARHGFDADLTKRDRKEVLPVMPFTEGVDVRSGGLAKVKRGRYAPMFMWLLGLLTFMVFTGEILLPDDGFGIPGDGTFNTPPLVEAADTGPFFHNNSVSTIEGAVGPRVRFQHPVHRRTQVVVARAGAREPRLAIGRRLVEGGFEDALDLFAARGRHDAGSG